MNAGVNNKLFYYWIIPAVIFSFNLISKFLYIDLTPIGGDEPFTLYYAQADLSSLWQMLQNENNPPLFTLLLKGWIELFGNSVATVRFLPLLFAAITPVYLYKTGIKIHSFRMGIVAATVYSFANYHIYFAHEIRPYALFGLLTAAAMYYFLCMVREYKTRYFILLTLINTLLVYNHFFGFFVFLIQLLGLMSLEETKRPFRNILLSWSVSALLYLPYFPIVFKQFFTSADKGTWLGPPATSELYSNLLKFSNMPVVISTILILITAVSIYHFAVKKRFKGNFTFLLLWVFVPYLIMFAVSFKVPMFLDRYLVFISIGFYLLIAYTLELIPRVIVKNIATFGIISMMIVTVNLKTGNKEPDDRIVTLLKKHRNRNTPVIVSPVYYYYNFAFHYDARNFSRPAPLLQQLEDEQIYALEFEWHLNPAIHINDDSLFFIGRGPSHCLETAPLRSKINNYYAKEEMLFEDGKNCLVLFSN